MDCGATLKLMAWDTATCQALARELLTGNESRLEHVAAVARASQHFASEPRWGSWIESAAWLHDIGYSDKLHWTGMHAIDGAAFLDRAGAPKILVSLVAFHTGAEYEADERGLTDKLILFDRPPQEALDLLILADLTSGPTGQPTTVEERIDEIVQRYEPQHPVHRAVTRSRDYLEACASRATAFVS